MSTEKQIKRLTALQGWATAVSAAGHRPPGADVLEAIAAQPDSLGGVDRAAIIQWVDAIEWILKQIKFGVHDPVQQMPTEFFAPKGGQVAPASASAPAAAPEAGADAHRLLLDWWERAVEENRPRIGALSKTKLLQVVRSGKRTPTEIAAILRGDAAKSFATEIAGILDGRSANALAPVPAPAPEPERVQSVVPVPAPAEPVPARREPSAEASQPSQPAPSPVSQPTSPVAPTPEFDPSLFAEFEFGSSGEEPRRIRAVRAGGGWTYSWPASDDAGVVIYRLVSGDEYPPFAPEKADFVTSTTATAAGDARPFTTAVRHLQVWCNRGADVNSALHAQPVLYATTAVVSPVDNFDFREDEGRVIGRWTTRPGTAAVQIYRVPVERAHMGADSPQYRIGSATTNLGGYVDLDAEPGRRYLYLVRCEASIDGTTRLSAAQQQEVAVAAVLKPVTDLAVVTHEREHGPAFDLSWTDPPSGRVVIYRTQASPNAGLGAGTLAYAALDGAGLHEDDLLPDPSTVDPDGRSIVAGVPWPRGWNRAYFTPVTVHDDVAHVGTTTFATRTGQVVTPRLVERVDRQILTFGWPEGAASVLVYRGVKGHDATSALSGDPHEISQGEYERFGGLHLQGRLPAKGCSLHAVAVSYEGGRRVTGMPVSVDYPGMMRMRYNVDFKRSLIGRTSSLTVTVTSELELPVGPPMVLVYNPTRLPLSNRDGTAIPVVPDAAPGTAPVTQFQQPKIGRAPSGSWRADVKDKQGFIRLFVDLPADRLRTLALLDPPIAKLRLDGSSGWMR